MSAFQRILTTTIADVARRARVSEMTVSRVVNGRQPVSDDPRTRVLKAIKQLEYVPSAAARGLARGQTNVIGILVPDIVSEWTLPLVLGAAREGERFGYRLLLHTSGYGAAQRMQEGVPIAESGLIDGLIVASWRVPASLARQLDARHKPVVLLDGYTRPREVM
jgi:LacI family transcriptional regulator